MNDEFNVQPMGYFRDSGKGNGRKKIGGVSL